jgi:iron uptake system component EfeO
MSVNLGSGAYEFRCAIDDKGVFIGPSVVVPGSVPRPVPAVKPVSQPQLIAPTVKYTKYVYGRLPMLAKQVATLRADIATRKRAKAKTDWLAAHLTYESLGAAYGAFGELDGSINGTARGLRAGVASKDFTGFHRIEYGLWHGQKLSALAPFAARLAKDVGSLQRTLANSLIEPLELTIRAHEITENALQFELNGKTDYGSHSNLATISANLAGTKVALDVLKPLLRPRYPATNATYLQLATTTSLVNSYAKHGAWPRLGSLPRLQREQVNAAISRLTELLAPVATILEPRITQ